MDCDRLVYVEQFDPKLAAELVRHSMMNHRVAHLVPLALGQSAPLLHDPLPILLLQQVRIGRKLATLREVVERLLPFLAVSLGQHPVLLAQFARTLQNFLDRVSRSLPIPLLLLLFFPIFFLVFTPVLVERQVLFFEHVGLKAHSLLVLWHILDFRG